MTTKEAIQILCKHNAWRRGACIKILEPVIVGKAIDHAIKVLKEKGKASFKTDIKK